MTGNPPVYEFSMDDALPQQSRTRPASVTGLRQDIVHAVIVGPAGHYDRRAAAFQQDLGYPAQQATEDGLLKAIGSQPYPVYGPDGNPCAAAATGHRRRRPVRLCCPPPPGTPG